MVVRSRPCAPRGALTRSLAAFLAVLMVLPAAQVLNVKSAWAAPADIFSSPAPVIGSDPPKSRDIKAGDATVSTQTGALSWSYSVAVPPGRNGMAPALALSYSSHAGLYGGIAAGFGWNLGIPEILEDTSEGRLKTHSPLIELTEPDPRADDRFLGLGGRRLVPVDEPKAADVYRTYRAQGDSSFQRYERLSSGSTRWRVLSTDGAVMEFGGPTSSSCLNVSDGYAPLTTMKDSFGNTVTYTYREWLTGECRIQKIEWGANAAAGLNDFAQVEFVWGSQKYCPLTPIAIGSQVSYRTGIKFLTGASQLDMIRVTAFDPAPPGQQRTTVHTRELALKYWDDTSTNNFMACNRGHAPIRFLKSLTEKAWGVNSPEVNLPPVELEYGDPAVSLVNVPQSTPWPNETGEWGTFPFLSFGLRYTDDRSPTTAAMLVDLNGDGLLDRLVIQDDGTTDGECRARWYRNEGPTAGSNTLPTFAFVGPITLPRLKWHGQPPSSLSPPPPGGGAKAEPGRGEKCSLSGQVTAFLNSQVGGGCHDRTIPGGVCHPAADLNDQQLYCAPNGRECPPLYDKKSERTYLHYRWLDADGDGLTDIVAAVNGDIRNYDIEQGNLTTGGLLPDPEPALFGTWPPCPGAEVDRLPTWSSTSEPPSGYRGPYTRCEGLYPWFIYKNQGNGAFATTPEIKYQPVPLESDQGDSNLQGPNVTSQQHAVMDFDGDGILDAVYKSQQPSSNHWWVWLGDGTGGLGGKRYVFNTNRDSLVSGAASAESTEGLFDLNADGLADHWQRIPDWNSASVFLHTGTEHSSTFQTDTPYLANQYAVTPGNDTLYFATPVCSSPGQGQPPTCKYHEGTTSAKNRTVDVDGDGRIDVVQDINGLPRVFFNVGGQFIPPLAYPGTNTNGLKRSTQIVKQDGTQGTWELLGDLVDLDGDGIAEHVYHSGGFVRLTRDVGSAAPRLLSKVNNGRGLSTTITYASMHDKTAVEQHPESLWPDGRPKASPSAQWVVRSETSSDSFAATTSTTSYFYKNPRHGADDDGRYSFRGFEEITSTSPSGAKTIQHYDYDVDWSGRLDKSLVVPAEAPNDVRSIDKTRWQEFQLFGGALKTHHATLTEHFTCANGQNEATCTASAAPGYTRTTTTLDALVPPGGTQPVLWQVTSSLLQSGTTVADGDRETQHTYLLKSTPDMYRLRPELTTRRHLTGGAMQVFSRSKSTWDVDLKAKLTDEVWFDNNDANRAITRYGVDMTTGNLLERWKPKQNAAATTKAQYQYDSRKLFITTEINERSHQLDHLYEYGTGSRIQTAGPNARTCTSNCPPSDPVYPAKEQSNIRVDGLGRTIETWDSFSNDGSIYTLYQTTTTSYVDIATPTAPTSTTHRQRLDTSASAPWKEERTEFDGHGRPLKTTVLAHGSAPNDHVTKYTYRNDGTLQTISSPDPTTNDANLVSYTYGFDSLGRATSIRRPDNANPALQSGINIEYDGVTQTASEFLQPGDGKSASTKTINDRLGRLAEVHELTDNDEWSVTTYIHGPDDIVSTIIDPEDVTTSLTHDFAGQRTGITRHGRTWKYTYDKNGNMITEQVPGSPNPPLTDPDYTTTIAYDDLDRPTSKIIAKLGMSAGDRDLFGSGTEVYLWDYGPNQKGRLRNWKAYAPNASLPTISTDFMYDRQGHRWYLQHTLGIAGYPTTSRSTNTYFNIFGTPESARFFDSIGGSNETKAIFSYDNRGFPKAVMLTRSGEANQTLAEQIRNVAGLVTKRRTNTTGPMTFVESNWTYDRLGRVRTHEVMKGPGPTQVVRQDLEYFGNDNPKSLIHALGTESKTLNFAYDLRHQLKSVTSSASGYFDAAYDYGPAGRFTHAKAKQTAPAPNSELKSRDVNYVYGGTDPEQVTELTRVDNGETFATYTYDAAGNQVTRTYPLTTNGSPNSESWDFVYDGKNQLRRVAKKLNGVVQGSEEYWYDGENTRIAVVKRDQNGAKIEMVWFIGDVQAHYDATGNVTKVYSHISMATPVARVERTSNATTKLEYQFHGLANNTIAAVANDGTINASYAYSPFGEVLEATNEGGSSSGTAAHKRKFNDKFEDDLTALSYYGFRYYDKMSMIWTQSDPLYRFAPDNAWKSPRKANLYTFVLGNPLRYVDPDGRESDPAGFLTDHLAFCGEPMTSEEIQEFGGRMLEMAVSIAVDAIAGTAADLYSAGESLVNRDYTGFAISVVAAVIPGVSARSAKKILGAVETTAESTAKSSRAARREVMREQGIPTSQQPTSQVRNESGYSYNYEVPKAGGGTQTKSVQDQTLDRSHPGQAHWEAGAAKTDPRTGKVRNNKHGRPQLKNDKSKKNYEKPKNGDDKPKKE